MSASHPCLPGCRILREYDEPEHGGECDARPARERGRALMRLLRAGLQDDALTAAVEAEARASWAKGAVAA